MNIFFHGKIFSLFFCVYFPSLSKVTAAESAEYIEPAVTSVSYPRSLRHFFHNMFDPYRLFSSLFDQYGAPGKPIYFYLPTMGNMLMVYDPKSLQVIAELEGKGVLKKGYSVEFIKRNFMGSAFSVIEDGELYSKVHSIMKPLFIQRKMETHQADTQVWVESFMSHLKTCNENEESLDLEEEMLTFTMGGISRVMLGYPIEIEKAKDLSRVLSRLLTKIMAEQFSFRQFIFASPPAEQEVDYQIVLAFLKEMVEHNQREQENHNPFSKIIAEVMQSTDLNQKEKIDQILNIFFGGHETTAHWLAVCLYELGLHQKSAFVSTMREEARAFQQGTKTLSDLRYVDAFMQEALRIDPSVPFYGREAIVSFDLNGFKVPAGTRILISPYAAHRWAGNWAESGEFKPERFLVPQTETRAFVPFGIGRRSCMGRHFATQEIKLFLIQLLLEGGEIQLRGDCKLDPHLVCTARFRTTPWARITFEK